MKIIGGTKKQIMKSEFADYVIEMLEELPRGLTLIEVEYCFLSMLLKKNKGNKTHLSIEAGISVTSVKKRIREMEYHGYPVEPMREKVKRGKTRHER